MNPEEQQYHISFWNLREYIHPDILPYNNGTRQDLDDRLMSENFIEETSWQDLSRSHYRVEYFEGSYLNFTKKSYVRYYYEFASRQTDNNGEEGSDVGLDSRSTKKRD